MRDILFKTLFLLGVPRLLRFSKSDTITVLNLHRISEERDYFYDPIKPETFFKLVDYCCKHYSVTSFENINKPTAKPKLILSFDDGYYDFIEHALPYLIKKGLPSNHNVVNQSVNENVPIWTHSLNELFSALKNRNITDDSVIAVNSQYNGNWLTYYMKFFHFLLTVDKQSRNKILDSLLLKYDVKSKSKMMSWDDIKYCSKNGVEIGSHSYTHDSLLTIANNADYITEISLSIKEISEKTGMPVHIFALPNGQYNMGTIDYFKTTDIKFVLLADDQINKQLLPNNKLNMISRIGLSDTSVYENILKTELFHSKIKKMR